MSRLSLATLGSVPAAARPSVDPRSVDVGIVHLGIGAFHRAHQAVYTEAAMAATGDLRWGICGVTQRSAAVVDQLHDQDGLYTVLVRDADRAEPHVVGAVRAVIPGVSRRDDVLARIADPATRVVTLTVTEKGYRHDPATGRLRVDDPAVRADVARPVPETVVGQLVRGVQRRMHGDAGPLTVLSCDNLPGNGTFLRRLAHEFAARVPEEGGSAVAAWLDAHVRFPSTMVDRIVPATTDIDRAEVARLLGVADHGVVTAEPFSQWVIEDCFAADRPAWERAGATLTADVTPYETMKLRLLNGGHSALAYLGALAGHATIAEAVVAPGWADYIRGLMDVDATPTLTVPPGFDVERYKDDLLGRFANPALRHRTVQVMMDGSQKLPQRLLATIRLRRRAGEEPRRAILAVAGWMRCVSAGSDEVGRPLPVDDPLAERLRAALDGATRPAAVVERLLGVGEVFGTDLRDDRVVRELLTEALRTLTDHGADSAVSALSTPAAIRP